MKSIIVHAYEDQALEGRLQVALDIARAQDAHLTCHYSVPYPMAPGYEPFGGVMSIAPIINELRREEVEARQSMERRLAHEDVRWDWHSRDGDAAQTLVDASALADLVIISQADGKGGGGTIPLLPAFVDEVVTHAGCPVLLLPPGCGRVDPLAPILVGWNGSDQAARALRAALPLVKMASTTHLVSIGEDADPFPLAEAGAYLSRHGVAAELHSVSATSGEAAEKLLLRAKEMGVWAIVMGAYGHSRLRETILGGVTRQLTRHSNLPLILGR
jgi:nucleotide-binding universal stress UspA family protein